MGGGLYEVRARAAEGTGRALYCTLVGQRIVILHAFVKKTQKTPDRELDLAVKRMRGQDVSSKWGVYGQGAKRGVMLDNLQ
jgi:phage-related protein